MTREGELRQVERLIRTLPPRTSDVYQRLVVALATVTESSIGLFFNVLETEDGPVFSGVFNTTGDPDADAVMRSAAGRPYRPSFDPSAPPRTHADRWVTLAEAIPHPLATPMWKTFYEGPGIDDQLRLLLYDGRRFLGWIGVFRRGRTYEPGVRRRLQRLTRATQDAVRAAERRAIADRRAELPGHLLFDATGRLVGASANAESWAAPERRQSLATLVRQFDRGGSAIGMVDRAQVSLLRLDGADGVRYLVDLTEARVPWLDPTSSLSVRQRAVADLVAHGLTNAEVAEELGISPHTVKQHLRAVYTRLGVASRLELREAMSQ